MVKEIELVVGEEHAVIALLEELAPKTCNSVWDALPIEGQLIHAKIAGGEFIVQTSIFLDELENSTVRQEAGNVCYWPQRQCICVFYNEVKGIGPVTLFGKIKENLDGVRRVAQRGWIRQGERVYLRKKEG